MDSVPNSFRVLKSICEYCLELIEISTTNENYRRHIEFYIWKCNNKHVYAEDKDNGILAKNTSNISAFIWNPFVIRRGYTTENHKINIEAKGIMSRDK